MNLSDTGSGNVRAISGSVIVSAMGTWSYNVAIAVYAYQQTHSTTWVALATVGRYVPALFITWFSTAWVHGFERRRVAVWADLICASVMFGLTAIAYFRGPLILAILLAAISSGVARIQSSATMAVAADVIPEARLLRTMGALGSADAVATAAGPAIASALLAVASPGLVFALNGLTFAISAGLLSRLRTSGKTRSQRVGLGTERAVVDPGVWRAVRPLLVSRTIVAVVYGFDVVLLAVIATERLRSATTGYGWLLAAAGAGGLLGALILRQVGRLQRKPIVVCAGIALYSLPLLVFRVEPDLLGSLVAQMVRGLGCVLVTATLITSLQRAVPSSAAAAVFGRTHSLVLGGTAFGAVVAPVLLHFFGLASTLVVAAVLPLLVQLSLLPSLVRFDRNSAALAASLDPQVDLLRGLTLFRDASRSTLIGMADRVDDVALAPGIDVVVEGAESDALYVLVSGSVEVWTVNNAVPVHLRTLTAPAYFGEIGLIHGVRRTATVTASTACTLWRIPAETFISAAVQAGISGALSESVRIRLSTSSSPNGMPVAAEI